MIFMVLPIDERSNWGRKLARLIFKNFVLFQIMTDKLGSSFNWWHFFLFGKFSGIYVSMLAVTFRFVCMWRTIRPLILIRLTVFAFPFKSRSTFFRLAVKIIIIDGVVVNSTVSSATFTRRVVKKANDTCL